ncbi:hypothetical protein ONZ45_g10586 [Pleurotus djamor]|nr:hypothetical protein ONZ45_g10586 [Pleurotus djamor]
MGRPTHEPAMAGGPINLYSCHPRVVLLDLDFDAQLLIGAFYSAYIKSVIDDLFLSNPPKMDWAQKVALASFANTLITFFCVYAHQKTDVRREKKIAMLNQGHDQHDQYSGGKCSWPLPIRVYDVEHRAFVSRSEIRNSLKVTITKAFKNRDPKVNERGIVCDQVLQAEMDVFAEMNTRLAILPHTWGATELTYQIAMADHERLMEDRKFAGLCERAAGTYGCSELDESIRTMYTWYASAHVCFVYIQDEPNHSESYDDELFFDRDWQRISFGYFGGDGLGGPELHPFDAGKSEAFRKRSIECATEQNWDDKEALRLWLRGADQDDALAQWLLVQSLGASLYDLLNYKPSADNARRIFSSMGGRKTSVPEDAAYCLFGLLGIVLPSAYGEGRDSALYRLQVACAERSNDRGLFYWDNGDSSPFNSMLPKDPFTSPPEPSCCENDLFVNFHLSVEHLWKATKRSNGPHPVVDHTFAFTNGGLRISVILHDCLRVDDTKFVIIDTFWIRAYGVDETLPSSSVFKVAILGTHGCDRPGHIRCFMIILVKCGPDDIPQYRRVSWSAEEHDYDELDHTEFLLSRVPETIYVV